MQLAPQDIALRYTFESPSDLSDKEYVACHVSYSDGRDSRQLRLGAAHEAARKMNRDPDTVCFVKVETFNR